MKSEISIAKSYLFEIIRDAGKLLLDNLAKARVLNKKSIDIKIDTDLIIEKFIIDEITKLFSDHNICSEESGNIDKGSEYTWIIDPIDGSYHYLKNFPFVAISVALKNKRSTLLGTVHNPLMDEFFWATIDEGAFLNETKIKVAGTTKLENSFLLIDFPNGRVDEKILCNSFDIMKRCVQKTYRVRVLGVSSLSICYVACGKVDAYISLSPGTRKYDIAAGMFILKKAGGKIKDLTSHQNPLLVCSNKKIHDALMEAIDR